MSPSPRYAAEVLRDLRSFRTNTMLQPDDKGRLSVAYALARLHLVRVRVISRTHAEVVFTEAGTAALESSKR